MNDDHELLRRYSHGKSEAAFGELVARHVGMVYSAAKRILHGDHELARDVSQVVFADFARKAGRLSPDIVVGGWLYRHTWFVAAQTIRSERRRRCREAEAARMHAMEHESNEQTWTRIAPLLDEALQRLSNVERDAVVLRYFQQHELRAVAATLGLSEDAARKRIQRALEKLRQRFVRRGITMSPATLATMLGSCAVSAVPGELAASTAASALTIAGAAAAAGNIVPLWIIKYMTITKLQTGIAVTLAALIGIPLAFQYQRTKQLGLDNEAQQINRDHAAAIARARRTSAAGEDPNRVTPELLRLRAQVGMLQAATNDLQQRLSDQQKASAAGAIADAGASAEAKRFTTNTYYPADQWADVGFTNAADAVQTFLWAGRSGNMQRWSEALQRPPEISAQMLQARLEASGGWAALPFAQAKGVKVLNITDGRSPSDQKYICEFDWGSDQPKRHLYLTAQQSGEAWKIKGGSQIKEIPVTASEVPQ